MSACIRPVNIWVVIVLLLMAPPAQAQWEQVGAPIFTPHQDPTTTIALDDAGTPYVATVVDTYGYELVVVKYDGSDWVQLGKTEMLSDAPVSSFNIALALGADGAPYVAILSYSAKGDSLITKKYDGKDWITLNSGGIIANGANHQRELFLAIDAADTPFIALTGEVSGIRVLKYDGTSWISAGFSSTYGAITGFGFGSTGSLRLAFQRVGLKAVMSYDKTTWTVADTNGLNSIDNESFWMPLNCKGSGEYAAKIGSSQGQLRRIMKHIGTSWVPMVNSTFPLWTNFFGLMTGGTDNPYIFIVDTARRSALLKYDGNKWVPTDTTGQPVSPTGLFSGMVGDGNGHFYIAPINRDQNDGLRIMKYTIPMTTGIANKNNNIQKGNICISPVPASQTLYIRNSNTALNGAQAIITDIQGRNVHQFTIAASQNIDISRWPTGIYCLHLPDGLVLKMLKN